MSINLKKGFTLIELLIVIAILGTLAVVVLIALNPVQQLARTRDAGRISTVTQLGHAMQALGTTRGGTYPVHGGTGNCTGSATTGTNWVTNCLVNGGEIQDEPTNPTYSANTSYGCGTGHASDPSGWCYVGTAAGGTVYTSPEASSNRSLCPSTGRAFIAFNTVDGRGGILCMPNTTSFPSAAAGAGGTWQQ